MATCIEVRNVPHDLTSDLLTQLFSFPSGHKSAVRPSMTRQEKEDRSASVDISSIPDGASSTAASSQSPQERVVEAEIPGEDTVEALRLQIEQLTAENTAMRPIVQRMAEARMCRDAVTMIESCPHCSLKRGGAYGYSGTHDKTCVVSQARRLGF